MDVTETCDDVIMELFTSMPKLDNEEFLALLVYSTTPILELFDSSLRYIELVRACMKFGLIHTNIIRFNESNQYMQFATLMMNYTNIRSNILRSLIKGRPESGCPPRVADYIYIRQAKAEVLVLLNKNDLRIKPHCCILL